MCNKKSRGREEEGRGVGKVKKLKLKVLHKGKNAVLSFTTCTYAHHLSMRAPDEAQQARLRLYHTCSSCDNTTK
eukprot:1156443-Pelagomonas_calceolata.AAC.11